MDVTGGFEFERRQEALSRAYYEMQFTEGLPVIKTGKNLSGTAQKRALSRRRRITGTQTMLFDDKTMQSLTRKRPPLKRKYVSMINANDIGKHRLVMGFVQKVELIDNVAKVTLLESDREIDIIFEESFIAESKNQSYLNKFAVIQHLADHHLEIAFTAIGEVRFNRNNDRFEQVILFGTDFRIEDMDLLVFAAKMELNE